MNKISPLDSVESWKHVAHGEKAVDRNEQAIPIATRYCLILKFELVMIYQLFHRRGGWRCKEQSFFTLPT